MNGTYSSSSELVEFDPTGRYGRYNEILGKGSSKIVYRAFDEYEGIEVAWNQVKLHDFVRGQEDIERLYCEIHLLKTLKHDNIMKFYTSWVDTGNRNINFVTEMFTSGTLRQYRLKYQRVNLRAIKGWCRQILNGLLYLHSHVPPIIHRDLKCDNIFINGNHGEVKIGDLGLASVLHHSRVAPCVGTPEFMAPEVYEEDYDELVDIYAFGMCVLEMVTSEYPYTECTHPAQIYKKVVSGKKPESLYKVEDVEVRRFVEKCLASASSRLSARELLDDPFLQGDDHEELLFNGGEALIDISINGRKEDNDIFLCLRIMDHQGQVRNINFHFDIERDTAKAVAEEMVSELDLVDHDVDRIASMIDGAVSSLEPNWKTTGLLMNELDTSLDQLCLHDDQDKALECCKNGSATVHGRFEEITYPFEESKQSDDEIKVVDDGDDDESKMNSNLDGGIIQKEDRYCGAYSEQVVPINGTEKGSLKRKKSGKRMMAKILHTAASSLTKNGYFSLG